MLFLKTLLWCLVFTSIVLVAFLFWSYAVIAVWVPHPELMSPWLAWPIVVILGIVGVLFVLDLGPFKPKQ